MDGNCKSFRGFSAILLKNIDTYKFSKQGTFGFKCYGLWNITHWTSFSRALHTKCRWLYLSVTSSLSPPTCLCAAHLSKSPASLSAIS